MKAETKVIIDEKKATTNIEQLKESPIAKDDWRTHEFSHPERTIRVGTLFSGIGAFEHALQRLGLKHKIVFAGDIDDRCKKAYFANYDISEDDWFSEVEAFDATPYHGKVDVIVGGAPCQAFSIAGKQLGFEDARGTLFYEFSRVVKETEPKIFIFENVARVLTHDNGRTWNVMYSVFKELGYDIHFRVLNAKDYGIPQSRNRLFCIGFKNKRNFEYPAPIELKYVMQDFLEDYDTTRFHNDGMKVLVPDDSRIGVADGSLWDEFKFKVKPVDEKYYLSEKMCRYVLGTGTKGYTVDRETDLPIAHALLHTMACQHRSGIDNYVTHTGRLRRLTPRESLRLMGFKDSFKIVCSDTATYQQAGNSIVVDVLIALIKQLDLSKYGVAN